MDTFDFVSDHLLVNVETMGPSDLSSPPTVPVDAEHQPAATGHFLCVIA
nr:pheromone precursor [Ganoderma boninense]